MDDEMTMEEPLEEEPDAFSMAASEAFPDLAGDPNRIAALKEAIKLCLESDAEGEYGGPKKKGGIDLALIMGPEKKK